MKGKRESGLGQSGLQKWDPKLHFTLTFTEVHLQLQKEKVQQKKNSPSGYRGRNDPARGDRRVQRLRDFVEMSLNLHHKDC